MRNNTQKKYQSRQQILDIYDSFILKLYRKNQVKILNIIRNRIIIVLSNDTYSTNLLNTYNVNRHFHDSIKKPTPKGVGFLNQIGLYLFAQLTDNA